MEKYLILFVLVLLASCNKPKKEQYTYFGGKIINPKNKFIYFGNHKGITDTLKIKDDHTFLGTFKDLKEGLYYFKHGAEFQHLFLSPNDSLLIRLNTWDFDESIVYSGTNAERNNALINTFLQNETDEKKFSKFYQLSTNAFNAKIDSVVRHKEAIFQKYTQENDEASNAFLNILKITTQYPVYRKIETYGIYNSRRKIPQKIPNNIYNYRKKINLKLDSLFFYPPYNNIVISQIYNDCYIQGLKENTDEFNTQLLKNIANKITTKKERNKLLRQITVLSFYRKSSSESSKKTFEEFFKLSSNENHKKEIKLLQTDFEFLEKGKALPNFNIIDSNGIKKNINETLLQKKSLLYFRNPKNTSDTWIASRINFYKEKYPTLNVLVININEDSTNYIDELEIKNQYFLSKNSGAHRFLTSEHSRMILINSHGVVENGFGALSSENTENQIKTLQ